MKIGNIGAFDLSERSIYLDSLGNGKFFAFNFAKPNGVVILSQQAACRLNEILSKKSLPFTEKDYSQIDMSLAKNLLINPPNQSNCGQINSAHKPKTFNVWLHVTNICNFSCQYCYIPELKHGAGSDEIKKNSLSREAVIPLLDQLFRFCESTSVKRLHIKFSGGEPTLNLPLIEYICEQALGRASSVRVSFGMISNGSFDSNILLPILHKFKFSLSISVDGVGANHDRIRHQLNSLQKLRGSWAQINDSVKRLRTEGISPHFLFTVTPQNILDLEEFASWSHSKLLGFRLSLVRQKIQQNHEVQVKIASILTNLYEKLGATMPTELDFERHAHFAEWDLSKQKNTACGSCRNYIAVSNKGDVSSCQMTMNSPKGNLLNETLDNIMHGFASDPKYKIFTHPELREGECTKCKFYHVCAGGCPQHTQQTYGKSDASSPWCFVYGNLLPVYIKSAARHLLRKAECLASRDVLVPGFQIQSDRAQITAMNT